MPNSHRLFRLVQKIKTLKIKFKCVKVYNKKTFKIFKSHMKIKNLHENNV
jgi:hypothetical protein